MDKIKQWLSSIRVSLMVCLIVTLLVAQILYLISLFIIDNAMLDLLNPRPDSFVFDNGSFVTINYDDKSDEPSDIEITNESLFGFYRSLRTLSPIIIYGLSIIVAIVLYYRFKLQQSLSVLEAGIQKIAEKELNFSIESASYDELGRLCNAFEDMRAELQQTFHSLWQSEENQRSLYRAFAHDLRTPITIIKGNNEIIEFVAAKNNDWDKAINAISLSNDAIKRIEQYAEQLKELESLDDWQPVKVKNRQEDLVEILTQQVYVLGREYDKRVTVSTNVEGSICLDWNGTIRILDNIIMNALQHATQNITIQIHHKGQMLEFIVCDDGLGFSTEALKKATTPFWSGDKSGGHIGLGLTIATSMIEKCGGKLQINNIKPHGACVKIIMPV